MTHPAVSESRPLTLTPVVTETEGAERVDLGLRGDLDLCTTGELREVLDRLCDEGYRVVVVDLSGIDFFGCVGLGLLVEFHRRLAADGRRLVLTRASPAVRRVVALTSVDTVLDLQDSMPFGRRVER